MRHCRWWARGPTIGAALAAAASAFAEPHGTALMVPAYFYPAPSGEWTRLADAARRVPVVAIANVFNGPGSPGQPDPIYAQVINQVQAAGGRVVGYVYTRYGERPLDEVRTDMTLWHTRFGIDGFFIDEMDNSPATARVAYYDALYQHAKSIAPNAHVTGNPGTHTDEVHATTPTADTLCVFESPDGYANYTLSPWNNRFPPERFLHLAYAVSSATTMEQYLALAHQRRAGYVYLTDDAGGNPWDRLPVYWDQEVLRVQEINAAAAIEQPPIFTLISLDTSTLHLEARCTVGRYLLEKSTDLHNWTAATSIVAFEDSLTIDWPVSMTTATIQYFRLRQ